MTLGSGKESACQCKKHRRGRFDPWVGKIPWRRKWQSTPVFLFGKSHEPRSLTGYIHGAHRVGHDWAHTRIKEDTSGNEHFSHFIIVSDVLGAHVILGLPTLSRKVLLFPFYSWGNLSLRKLSDVPRLPSRKWQSWGLKPGPCVFCPVLLPLQHRVESQEQRWVWKLYWRNKCGSSHKHTTRLSSWRLWLPLGVHGRNSPSEKSLRTSVTSIPWYSWTNPRTAIVVEQGRRPGACWVSDSKAPPAPSPALRLLCYPGSERCFLGRLPLTVPDCAMTWVDHWSAS